MNTTTAMIALRWNGPWLSARQLADRAAVAVNKVDTSFAHLDLLNIQALADEAGQYVQLIVVTSASQGELAQMRAMLKNDFESTTRSEAPCITSDPQRSARRMVSPAPNALPNQPPAPGKPAVRRRVVLLAAVLLTAGVGAYVWVTTPSPIFYTVANGRVVLRNTPGGDVSHPIPLLSQNLPGVPFASTISGEQLGHPFKIHFGPEGVRAVSWDGKDVPRDAPEGSRQGPAPGTPGATAIASPTRAEAGATKPIPKNPVFPVSARPRLTTTTLPTPSEAAPAPLPPPPDLKVLGSYWDSNRRPGAGTALVVVMTLPGKRLIPSVAEFETLLRNKKHQGAPPARDAARVYDPKRFKLHLANGRVVTAASLEFRIKSKESILFSLSGSLDGTGEGEPLLDPGPDGRERLAPRWVLARQDVMGPLQVQFADDAPVSVPDVTLSIAELPRVRLELPGLSFPDIKVPTFPMPPNIPGFNNGGTRPGGSFPARAGSSRNRPPTSPKPKPATSRPARSQAATILQMGKNLEKKGNSKAAREYYQRVRDEFPDSPEAEETKQRLESLAPGP